LSGNLKIYIYPAIIISTSTNTFIIIVITTTHIIRKEDIAAMVEAVFVAASAVATVICVPNRGFSSLGVAPPCKSSSQLASLVGRS
jgi:hypothetical protein